jgi:hypothetical protein
MAPKHPHHLEPDSPDLSTAIGNFHQSTSLSPPKDSVFSLRNAKKALRIRTAEKKADQKERERTEKAAKKTEKENAEAAKRAGREQREATDKMKKLEMEAEKQRLRREEQTANMKKQRRREEEKERVAEQSRHKRALEGMSWGFDPGAGMRVNRDSGNGHGGTIDVEGSGGHGELEEAGLQKTRRGSTWGITGGGPGRTGGDDGSDVSRL